MFRKRPTATGGGAGAGGGSSRIHLNGGSSSTTVLLEQSAASTLNGRNGTNSTTMLPLHHHHQTSMSPLVDKDDADAYDEKYDKNRRSGGGGSYSQRRRQIQQQRERLASSMLLCMGILYLIKRMVFPLSHDQLNAVDQTVRRLWVAAERFGLIEKFPAYSTDYMEHFPYFSLLEEHYQVIRDEAQQLLDSNTRNHIPRLKDLVETKRAQGKVYSTDWKTYWFKMGQFIPENEARAPKTAALLRQMPNVYNAFWSVLEPHQHIDPHWGHYKGFLRYHLGLIVPGNNTHKDCYLRIRNDIEKNTSLWLYEREELLANGTYYYWHEGQGVMFDDNPLHDATNESDDVRVVLFLDVARNLPWYLNAINRIAIFVANRQAQIVNMRKRAVLDEGHELSVG